MNKQIKYILTFSTKTAAIHCHAEGCSAARATPHQNVFDEHFDSVAAAKAHADADESERAGEPTEAWGWKVCKCAKSAKANGKK
jgi:hypothetical protein